MSLKSVYLPEPQFDKNLIRVSDDEHHHLKVGRAEQGEKIEIFDGRGTVWNATIVSAGRRETVAEVQASRFVEPDQVQLILGMALIRSVAFELALEKAVEIGVNRIVPIVASRSNVTTGRRLDRWSRILIEAAKQSKRYHLPKLDDPMGFDQILTAKAASKIMFAEHDGGPLKSALFGSPVLYLIGPEGGWTEIEIDEAQKNGFASVTLGAGILRSETAAIVGGSLIRYELQMRH